MALAMKESSYAITLPALNRTFEFKFSAAFLPALVLAGRLTFGFYFR